MAIDGTGGRPLTPTARQPIGADAPAPASALRESTPRAQVDGPAAPAEKVPRLPAASRPALPEVREDLLEGLSPQEAYAALASKWSENRTQSLATRMETAEQLRVQNAPVREQAVQKAADNFFSRLWDGLVKTVTSNPAAAIGLVVTTVTSIAGVIASGGAGIPAAIATISAAAAPFVAAVAANAGFELDKMLANGIEQLLMMAGVDDKSAWKAARLASSAISLGISIGTAVVSRNVSAFDANRVADFAAAIADAFEMRGSAVNTISDTVKGFASLGILIGGSIASGTDVLSYGGLDKILAGGEGVFKDILAAFSQGLDLKKLGDAAAGLGQLVPLIQNLVQEAFTDLQANGNLLDGLQKSWQAIIDHVAETSSLAHS
ncbi:MAG: hypothetical protein EBT33_01750 [Betaproteobacteria bacterium]|nr:hypothetical protein [Betaproteobacteria bacterium]